MIKPEKVIIALDTPDQGQVTDLLKSLSGQGIWVKVGMEVFYSLGPKVIHEAKDHGFKIFLDLKLHDIPNTVAQATKALLHLPINMLNVHAAGGSEMMKAAVSTLKSQSHPPLLIAVTQLTSTTQSQMNSEQKITGDVLESVVNYADLAKKAGLDGVVSSALEVAAIKLVCGSRFLTVTPGIRPQGMNQHDQSRTTTPLEAMRLGTDFIVVGRPITQSPRPKEALESLLKGE